MVRSNSSEPEDPDGYSQRFDRLYTRFATLYARFIQIFPIWRRWLDHALPHIRGPRVLEISFGIGYLFNRFAAQFDFYGVDYNFRLAQLTVDALREKGIEPRLQVADVAALPYHDGMFDCIVNTMVFSGYPDTNAAMHEIHRVRALGGRLVMIDVNYPPGWNPIGFLMACFWKWSGDLLRNMSQLMKERGFEVSQKEVGGFGSVQLFIAQKTAEV